jgi:ubiquinone/menaquinone biosynthesis C-methylase UbiE
MSLASQVEIRSAYEGNAVAARYVSERFANELHGLLHRRQVAAGQKALDAIGTGRALEIAPGPGRLTRDLRPTGQLTCLEFNEGMIAEGRRACGQRASWVRGNGFQLPFAAEFSMLYSFRFIRHFHGVDRARLFGEIRRVLLPGGLLVMDAVNERISRPLRETDPKAYTIYDKLYQPDQLQHELAGAGFETVSLEPVQKCYRWQSLSQWLIGPRSRWLNRVLINALERLPMRDGLEWIVTCRRG